MSVKYQFLQNHPLGSSTSQDLPFSNVPFPSFLQFPALLPETRASPPLCRMLIVGSTTATGSQARFAAELCVGFAAAQISCHSGSKR